MYYYYLYALLSISFRGGPDSSCLKGHQGPLCGCCIQGYSKFGKNCYRCEDIITNTVGIVGFFLILLFSVILLVMFKILCIKSDFY